MLCRARFKNSAEHFAINRGLEFQKDMISLGYFVPEYHNFLIPARQMNLISKHFCLDDLISFDTV